MTRAVCRTVVFFESFASNTCIPIYEMYGFRTSAKTEANPFNNAKSLLTLPALNPNCSTRNWNASVSWMGVKVHAGSLVRRRRREDEENEDKKEEEERGGMHRRLIN